MIPREFRAAWVACVYNIDWPSSKNLSAGAQKKEVQQILSKLSAMNMNAVLLQVRPNADAAYRSALEPWTHWISGTMGRNPGYDPLQYWIQAAHARGIEVHAWFNPYRALPNFKTPAARNHVTRMKPGVIRRFKSSLWMDPASRWTQQRTLQVMMDVVRRYDIDGLHIDDYFYPYPQVNKQGRALQQFPDGKTPSQRRAAVDGFVQQMYSSVKRAKPWVRVGISPFGIWRPGVPQGTTARIDAYHHLAADSRKWLAKGWCDYLSPQLYWRINSDQSYRLLLDWWKGQGPRPVWPGIAAARVKSTEDPGRPASEILNQAKMSRQNPRNYVGQVYWSMKSLMQNRGGVSQLLQREFYQEPALVPPMPWSDQQRPATPVTRVMERGGKTLVTWSRVRGCQKYAVQARYGGKWRLVKVLPGDSFALSGQVEAVAVSAVSRSGMTSAPAVFQKN